MGSAAWPSCLSPALLTTAAVLGRSFPPPGRPLEEYRDQAFPDSVLDFRFLWASLPEAGLFLLSLLLMGSFSGKQRHGHLGGIWGQKRVPRVNGPFVLS